MATETDLFLRRCQIQHRHVAFGLRQMADGARNFHRGMHGLALGLIDVTRGTVGILGHDAGVLDGVFDGGCRHRRGQKQHGNNRCTEFERHAPEYAEDATPAQ